MPVSVVNGNTSLPRKFFSRSSIGIDAELEGGVVDEPLEERGGLGPAGTAIRAHRRGVGDGDRHLELDGGKLVRAVRHALRAGGQERADAGIGAGVADQPYPQTGERAVGLAAELGVLHLAAAVRQRPHVFAARRHPHDRTVERARRLGDDDVFGMHAGLAAEAAADLRGDDVQLLRPPAECTGQLTPQHVRHLGGRPHGDATVVGRRRRAAVGLHRHDRHPRVDVAPADDDVGHRLEIDSTLVGDEHRLVRAVVGEDQLGALAEGGLGVGAGRQGVDVGPDGRGGVLAVGQRRGEHDGDRLADEAHAVDGERRTGEVVVHLGEAVMRGDVEVGRRPHGDHAGHGARVVDVDGR